MSGSLGEVLARSRAILLDFDGPVCSVFAGYAAPKVAAELLGLLQDLDVGPAESISGETDPIEVLRWSATLGTPDVLREVEERLRRAELFAVQSAEPTPNGEDVIRAAERAGRPVAIVSNNSAPAIEAYLAAHRLRQHITSIVGRPYARPDRMKPHPWALFRAASAADAPPGECVLIGDSGSDIEAAKAAGVPVIAYANKPWKRQRFAETDADAVATSMAEVAAALMDLA